jgi:glycosyltransferase 2 family protein
MENAEDEIGIEERRPLGRLAWGFILLILVSGAVLIARDWQKFADVLTQADVRPMLVAVLLTGVSYICVSSAFAVVSQLLGIRMSFRSLTETGFVSIILNHVLTTGGVAGYSLRYILMRRHGVPGRDILAASALHYYLTSLDMLTMLPVGFLYLLLNASLPRGVMIVIGMMTLAMAVAAVIVTGLIFMNELRSHTFNSVTRIGHRFLHRDFDSNLQRFDATMRRGVAAMRHQPMTVLQVMALTWIDWWASVAVVWLCFDALGKPVSVGVILSGYVIGVTAGVLSMVPGGFGVQEGSMAGIFYLLGASFQQALLASILFRGIYFLLPYGVSLAFYGRLLRQTLPEK